MATLTETKRSAFPARYARKDARGKIYRAVFGRLEGQAKRSKGYRDTNTALNYSDAKYAYEVHRLNAALTPDKEEAVWAGLEALKKAERRARAAD